MLEFQPNSIKRRHICLLSLVMETIPPISKALEEIGSIAEQHTAPSNKQLGKIVSHCCGPCHLNFFIWLQKWSVGIIMSLIRQSLILLFYHQVVIFIPIQVKCKKMSKWIMPETLKKTVNWCLLLPPYTGNGFINGIMPLKLISQSSVKEILSKHSLEFQCHSLHLLFHVTPTSVFTKIISVLLTKTLFCSDQENGEAQM